MVLEAGTEVTSPSKDLPAIPKWKQPATGEGLISSKRDQFFKSDVIEGRGPVNYLKQVSYAGLLPLWRGSDLSSLE